MDWTSLVLKKILLICIISILNIGNIWAYLKDLLLSSEKIKEKMFLSTTFRISEFYLKVLEYHIMQLDRTKLLSHNSY